MKIAATNSVVSIHYTLTDEEGAVIDSSEGSQPLKYLSGAGNIIPGLENALTGLAVGDTKNVTVQPEDGYGEIDPDLIQTLPKSAFAGVEEVEVGMEFQSPGPDGQLQYIVVKDVAEDGITIDANHALAGRVLHFAISVESIREASEDEIAHGHVH